MRILAGAAIATSIAALSLASPAAATVAISGDMIMQADAVMGAFNATSPSTSGWIGAPTSLSANVSATATDGVDFVNVFGTGASTWSSANQGSVTFRSAGWDFEVADPANAGDEGHLNNANPNWDYTFTATSNGMFTMNYNVTATGNTFGLQGWYASWSGPGGDQNFTNALDPTASGSFSRVLTAGQTYTIALNNFANIETTGTLSGWTGSMNGQFDWQISGGVPEPTSWALMITGFGLMGMAMRRRSRKAALAAA